MNSPSSETSSLASTKANGWSPIALRPRDRGVLPGQEAAPRGLLLSRRGPPRGRESRCPGQTARASPEPWQMPRGGSEFRTVLPVAGPDGHPIYRAWWHLHEAITRNGCDLRLMYSDSHGLRERSTFRGISKYEHYFILQEMRGSLTRYLTIRKTSRNLKKSALGQLTTFYRNLSQGRETLQIWNDIIGNTRVVQYEQFQLWQLGQARDAAIGH